MKHTVAGYIIPLSLMLLSLGVVIVTAVGIRGVIFSSFATAIINQEQVRMLALSGVQVAISQLADRPAQEEASEKKEGQKTAAPDVNAQLLKRLLPYINQWQRFVLKEAVDGIDGEIMIYLASEDGKISLNQIFDFAKQQYKVDAQTKADWKVFMNSIMPQIAKNAGAKDLNESLLSYLKKQKQPLTDLTQLLSIPAWQVFNNALVPAPRAQKKIYLMDMFTLENNKGYINPWLMSQSLINALNLQSPTGQERSKAAAEWIKNYKGSWKFPDDWKTMFMPLYQKEWQTLPKGIESFFATTFDPMYFCVVSYGRVGENVQSMYVILERVKQVVKGKTIHHILIKKAYWL